MNLAEIQLRRAEEQMHSDVWRRADRMEGREAAPRTCQVPGCWNPITSGRTICDECKAQGLAATPCKCCGGRIRRRDQMLTRKHLRGICGPCRVDMDHAPGNRDLSAAREALARRAS